MLIVFNVYRLIRVHLRRAQLDRGRPIIAAYKLWDGLMVIQITRAPEKFSDWTRLLQLLQESFAFMEERIDPPSSVQRMTSASIATSHRERLCFWRQTRMNWLVASSPSGKASHFTSASSPFSRTGRATELDGALWEPPKNMLEQRGSLNERLTFSLARPLPARRRGTGSLRRMFCTFLLSRSFPNEFWLEYLWADRPNRSSSNRGPAAD